MSIFYVSGSGRIYLGPGSQETTGSAPVILFSPCGPNIATRQMSTDGLKANVVDTAEETVPGPGKVWALANCASQNPSAVNFRTQIPAYVKPEWFISLEAHYGHAGTSTLVDKFIQLSWAGRVMSEASASNGNSPHFTGSWTSTNVNFSGGNGGLKQTGWYPFGEVADNSGHYALPTPAATGSFLMQKSRYIKLKDFVNEADGLNDEAFKQGGILDIAIARDLDPTRNNNSDPGGPLGNTNVRLHSVKIVYNQITGSA